LKTLKPWSVLAVEVSKSSLVGSPSVMITTKLFWHLHWTGASGTVGGPLVL
jgi:hypothetical protein